MSFPLFDSIYTEIFQRIKVTNPQALANLSINYFFDEQALSLTSARKQGSFLAFIAKIQQHFKLNLWKTKDSLGSSFLLVKDRLLLTFNELIDGTPLLTPIFHKSYLYVFHLSLLKKDMRKISCSRSEATAFLRAHPRFIPRLVRNGIDCVYNFIPVGYHVEKNTLTAAADNPDIADMIWQLFNSILTQKTTFVSSISAIERFNTTGHAFVPVVGAIPLHAGQRMQYMQRFHAYLNHQAAFETVKIIDSPLANLAILCSSHLCIIYATDESCSQESIHIFPCSLIAPLLEQETAQSRISPLDFSGELWNVYSRDKSNI